MMSRRIFVAAVVAGTLAFLAMIATTAIWMTVPVRIIYRESSGVRTDAASVEVVEHGSSFFLTPAQKKTVDMVRNGTPWVWFGSLGIAVVAILTGAAALLRIPGAFDR